MNRKPWLAGLLSALLPGLGQLYNGQTDKALKAFLLVPPLAVGLIWLFLHFPMWPLNLVVPPAVQLGVWVYLIRDAVRGARALGNDFQPRRYNNPFVYVAVLALFVLLVWPAWAGLTRRYVARSFVAGSDNMEPAIMAGDHIIADTWRSSARRGDVVFFSWPDEGESQVISRLVALPGDTVEMRRRVLRVQGQEIAEPRVRHNPGEDLSLPEMMWQKAHVKAASDTATYRPTLDNWGPLVVPAEMHFVLGDNRAMSLDSRFRGFVPGQRIGGRLHVIYFSRDPETGAIRWSRLGKVVG